MLIHFIKPSAVCDEGGGSSGDNDDDDDDGDGDSSDVYNNARAYSAAVPKTIERMSNGAQTQDDEQKEKPVSNQEWWLDAHHLKEHTHHFISKSMTAEKN